VGSAVALNFESPRGTFRVDGDISETLDMLKRGKARPGSLNIRVRRDLFGRSARRGQARRRPGAHRHADRHAAMGGSGPQHRHPSGGAETTDGAIYQSMGLLTDYPQLSAALNGDADRFELSVSGVAISGEIAAIAQSSASDIRGASVDFGLILFDDATGS
jgi:hypothetical protein